jgi:uncharacterized protein
VPITPTYPGLYIEELPSPTHTIIPAPTSITVFVGYGHPVRGQVAERGDWGKPFQIFNFTDYVRMFGGYFHGAGLDTNLPDAVYQFFVNGGTNAYVVALQPTLYTFPPGGGAPTAKTVTAASTTFSGMTIRGKQVTDVANPITVTVNNVVSPANDTADIVITFGPIVEVYRAVTVAAVAPGGSSKPDFIENQLARSDLVTVEPQVAGGTFPATYNLGGSSSRTITLGDMGAGNGVPFYRDDFTAVFKADAPLDKVDIFNLLVLPGVADKNVWTAALTYCGQKRAFFIMDPAPNWSADDTFLDMGMTKIQDGIDSNLVPTESDNGALYFPYLQTTDPVTGQTVDRPPSGFVAGVIARTDTARGVWKAPAGLEASIANTDGVVDSGKMTDMRQGTLNPIGVNVLRAFPGAGTVIWGARTLGTATREPWRYVPVRRMALFLEQTLLANLGWVVFEPNDEPLWTAIRISVEGFMLSLFRQGAFEGSTPSSAFVVQCDHSTTTDDDIDKGIVNIIVGFRALKPAEFVVIKIAQLAGQAQ